jgi:hypothetical protein
VIRLELGVASSSRSEAVALLLITASIALVVRLSTTRGYHDTDKKVVMNHDMYLAKLRG